MAVLYLLQGVKPTKVLILHYSFQGHIETMAWEEEAKGAVVKRRPNWSSPSEYIRDVRSKSPGNPDSGSIGSPSIGSDVKFPGPGRRAWAQDKLAANSVRLSHRAPHRR
ncbi:MAG: hypothetical protein G4V63_24935 [Candidatus Afipia apatlaquensis]|uniref:Uncharacterized protein n=1 Tax=Candidatus Afipia apatlaquensis TaxID=2712852 RepID=A0A7C9VM54_9BRAD|nr:hypothetical protein [Candidatus Afipia apatlaquensis]